MNQITIDKFLQLNPYEWVLLGAFVLLFFMRLYYLLFFTGRILFKPGKEIIANEVAVQPISIVLTVRNEEENLRRILPQLLGFDMKYEVIAVDDYSLDNTYTVLGKYKQLHPHFKISSLNEETRFSVKLAQNLALKAAGNNWVLLFPVEAVDATKEWINGFLASTSIKNRNVLIGYTGLVAKPGLFNLLCRLEMLEQQTKSAGFISNGIPFVYFEDNVAFKKQAYFDLGGFGAKTKEAYANLELIINKFITKKQTSVLFNSQTKLVKNIEVDKDDYFNLLRRSIRIENYLPAWKRFLLGFDGFTSAFYLPLLLIVLFYFFDLWPVIMAMAGVKILAHLIIMKISQNRLNERKIFIPSLVYGLLSPYYKMFYGWHFKQQSRKKWRTKI